MRREEACARATFYFLLFTFYWFFVRQRYTFSVLMFSIFRSQFFTNFAVSVPLSVTTFTR